MGRAVGSRTMKVQVNARYRAWHSMRMLRQFTISDLVATAEIGVSNVGKYLLALKACGYVRVTSPKRDGVRGGCELYRLVKNTGPKPPRCRSNGMLYDPNTDEEINYE